ncbi:MAG TPA: acyltransferase [Candidatus Binataceae bacterium]|nr:acyltransferase [Candidatus Binataceae bacterium]
MAVSPQSSQAESDRTPANPKASAPRFYVPELDPLRFFSFFGVFIWHLPLTPLILWKPGVIRSLVIAPSFGAALLMTVSGYLNTTLLLKEAAKKGRVDAMAFYTRRFLRIAPLYYIFIAIIFLLSSYSNYFDVTPGYLLSMMFFMGNSRFFQSELPIWNYIIGPLWTVSVEFHFYMLVPWLVGNGSRRRLLISGWTMIAVAFISRIVWVKLGNTGPLWINTLADLDMFGVGILIAAIATTGLPELRLPIRALLVIGGLSAWFSAVYFFDFYSLTQTAVNVSIAYPALAFGNGALMLASIGAGKAGARFMLNEWLQYLGAISCGLYVYHGLAILTTRLLMFEGVLAWAPSGSGAPLMGLLMYFVYAATAFVLTVAMAAASYRWLETPFLKIKTRFTYVPSHPV